MDRVRRGAPRSTDGRVGARAATAALVAEGVGPEGAAARDTRPSEGCLERRLALVDGDGLEGVEARVRGHGQIALARVPVLPIGQQLVVILARQRCCVGLVRLERLEADLLSGAVAGARNNSVV